MMCKLPSQRSPLLIWRRIGLCKLPAELCSLHESLFLAFYNLLAVPSLQLVLGTEHEACELPANCYVHQQPLLLSGPGVPLDDGELFLLWGYYKVSTSINEKVFVRMQAFIYLG